jgi:hypothetical protein
MKLDISDLRTINWSIKPSDMSDPLSRFRNIQSKQLKTHIFHICVPYDQQWGVYKWEICRSHNQTNIKINLGSSKSRAYKDKSLSSKSKKKKRKRNIFFTQAFLASACKPTTWNISIHKPSILINCLSISFQIHTLLTLFASIINNAN